MAEDQIQKPPIETAKVKFIAVIEADKTAGIPPNTGFDGSSVVPADAAADILSVLQTDSEWANAVNLSVTVKQVE